MAPVPRPQALIRAVELLRLVSPFIDENDLLFHSIRYDGAVYDGADFMFDCEAAAEALEAFDHNQMSLDL